MMWRKLSEKGYNCVVPMQEGIKNENSLRKMDLGKGREVTSLRSSPMGIS